MPDECISLIREVERLVTAPYVPSLQDLHEIVQSTSPGIINSWEFCKPCQIGLLVDVLVEGLSLSSVALDLLCAFGSAPAFRDALFERYPAILDKFLEKAIEIGDPKYTLACTVLLSSPVPTNFITPARLAPFITKLVSQMADNPREETISPLYMVMTGLQNSPQILNEVPAETMTNFQTELTKILRSLDDHMGNLLCLATFARIVKSDIKHGPQTQPPSWLENMQHFFGPKRGLKTLDLVVLRVILACSASCGSLGAGKTAESVRLAIEICDAVELERKQAWMAGNSSKIAKLCEKVTRDGIGQEVQMIGIAFLTCILPGSGLPSEIPRLGLHGLLSMDSRQILEVIPSELIPRLVEAIAIAVGEPAICSLLNYTFSVLKAVFPGGENIISTVRLASLFFSGLRELEGYRARELASSLGKETILRLLDHFPKRPSQSQCQGSIVCYTELATSENQFFLDALDFCSSPDVDNDSLAIPGASIIAAFTRQVRRSLCAYVCGFAASKSVNFPDPFFLPDHRQILPNAYPRRDWKAGIAETVASNSRNLHKNMMEQVQEICHDLERRCYDTEGPLRVVEKERDSFRFEAEQFKQENAGLKDQIQQSSGTISNLQHEMTCLEEHAQSSSARVDDLSARLEAAQEQLKEQQQSSEEAVRRESEKARTKELELIATLTEKEDQLEELQGEMDEQRTENGEIRKTLDCVSKEKAVSLENGVSLRQEIARLEESVDSCKRTMAERGHEIQRLFGEGENAKMVTETLQKQLGEATAESNGLKSALTEAEKHFGCEMETVKQQYELRLSNANADSVKQKEENKSLQSAMQTAASDASKELQTKDRKIHRLEKKIQSLQEERETTAREFSEAQQHMGRLMNVMGFQRATESNGPRKHRSTLAPSQGATMQQKILSDDADTQTQPDILVGESFESTTSTISGPTPKRPRGNPSLQRTPSAPSRSAYSQKTKVLPTRTRTQRQERKPLGDADQNSPLKSQRHGISKSNGGEACESQAGPTQSENYTQGIDFDGDLDFSKDFLFTSTCFSEANRQLDSFGPG